MIRTVLFDLDGTLTDSGRGICNSVRYALDRHGFPEAEEAVLRSFVGPPLVERFMSVCGVSEDEARRMVTTYREYYVRQGIFENEVYPGIPLLLQDLRRAGRRIALATSKPEIFARQVLEHFDLLRLFDAIAGEDLREPRDSGKPALIARCMALLGAKKSETVMVGDRNYDVEGGKACGIGTIGVLYGYGSREELEAAGADHLAASAAEVLEYCLK